MDPISSSYDRVAEKYAAEFENELERKPFDRKMLDWLIEKTEGAGAICDLGCGPGQVARYLQSRGAPACGIDLSPGMVKCAQRMNPSIPFQQGDMQALTGVADSTFRGVAAFYSIIHVPSANVLDTLREIKRVLQPGGVLLLAFHIGTEIVHKDEWWGQQVSVDFIFYETAAMKDHLQSAGFDIEEAIERDPYGGDVEYPSRRAYIFARRD
jgi:ubiquinone/menaquinone biosynthesis C-methylase UbiE